MSPKTFVAPVMLLGRAIAGSSAMQWSSWLLNGQTTFCFGDDGTKHHVSPKSFLCNSLDAIAGTLWKKKWHRIKSVFHCVHIAIQHCQAKPSQGHSRHLETICEANQSMIVVVTGATCEAHSEATVGQCVGYCSINPEALRSN